MCVHRCLQLHSLFTFSKRTRGKFLIKICKRNKLSLTVTWNIKNEMENDVKMCENEMMEIQEKSIEVKENNDENVVLVNTSIIIEKKIEDFVGESENSVELIETNVAQVNSQNIQEQPDNFCMKVDEKTPERTEDKVDVMIVEEVKNNDTDINKSNITGNSEETNTQNIENREYSQLHYDWTTPKLICSAVKEFEPTEKSENFTKGCHWSPDGTCIMVPSDDFKIRVFELPRELYNGSLPEDFNVPSFQSYLKIKEGGTIYDTCWFPYMSAWEPSTCCFLSTSQGSPIHLWDAFTGQLRATYRAYNQVDEVEAAISVQFTDNGGQIWSGFKNALRTFDTDRPGRQTNTIYLKKDFPNVTGVVSCIRENPGMSGLIAFGTYSKCIGLYKDGPLCSFLTTSGVTQIEFSPCGTKLYSAVRRGSEFLCWDLRNPGTVLYSLQNRQSNTNQRIHFSLSYNGEDIVSGGTDGAVRIWKIPSDLQVEEDLNPHYKIQMTKDCINGVSLHKNLPILAVSTGTRICDEEEIYKRNNSLRFYWLGSR